MCCQKRADVATLASIGVILAAVVHFAFTLLFPDM